MHGKPRIDTRLSDHWSVLFRMKVSKPPVVLRHVHYRNTKDIDLAQFVSDVKDSVLLTNSHENLSDLVQMYNDCLSGVLDTHAPVVEKDVAVRARQPWFNDNIRKERQLRRKYERQLKKSKTIVNEDLIRIQDIMIYSIKGCTKIQEQQQS